MNPKLSFRLILLLSLCYGIVVAILGFLGSPALTIVAVIGALVLGVLWVVRGLFSSRDRSA